ncbi:MAG: hypothetical protein KA035_03995 [Candidatus Levybacteria bacterium]|nr:hypothetical protein [Candidatus Levybacteria bacterium]
MDTPEKAVENKKALKIFGIEAAIIILLIVVIISVLIFLNVIPLRSLIPGLPGANSTLPPTKNPVSGFDPTRAAQLSLTPPIDKGSIERASISVISKNPNFSINLINQGEFLEVLKRINIYGKKYDLNGESTKIPVDKMEIVFVNQPGDKNIYKDDQGIYMTTIYKAEEGKIIADVYVADRILNTPNTANMLLKDAIIRNSYRLAQEVDIDNKLATAEAEVNKILGQIPADLMFFEIDKETIDN